MSRADRYIRQSTAEASRFCDAWPDAAAPPKLVIMCGVGIGTESRVFKERWPECLVIGVDPYVNRAEDAHPACHLIRAAIVGDPTVKDVTFWWRRGKTMASSMFPKPDPKAGRGESRQTVPAITLDNIFTAFNRLSPVALWMDCEGGELGAMRGGQKCLAATKLLLAETFVVAGRVGYPRRREIFGFLQESGFVKIFANRGDSIWQRANGST